MSEQSTECLDNKSILELQKQNKEQLEIIVKGMREVEVIHKRDAVRLDVLDALHIDKIAEKVSLLIDSNNKIDAKLESMAKSQEQLQKLSYSMPGMAASSSKALEEKYEDALERYLKHKVRMDSELSGKMVDHIIKSEYKGLTDISEAKLRSEMLKDIPSNKDLQSGVNPDGGYWVIPQRLSQMVTRIFETSPLLQLATSQPSSSKSVELVIADEEAQAQGAVGEVELPTQQATPTIGLLTIPVHRIASGRQRITQDLIDDATFDVTGWLLRLIADKLRRLLNTDMIVGTGAIRARGILTYPNVTTPGTYERGAIEQIPSGSATDYTYNGFVDLQSSVKEDYQANSVFMMKRQSFGNVLKIKSSDFVPLINANQLAESPTRIILGSPVLFADDFDAVGAGALAAAYGDFRKGYMVVPRFGIRILRDIFTQNPLVSFTADMRQGGDVTNYESFKIQEITT